MAMVEDVVIVVTKEVALATGETWPRPPRWCRRELGLLLFAVAVVAAIVAAGQDCGRSQTGHSHDGGHDQRRVPVDETVIVVVAKVALATIDHVADAATMVMAEGVTDAATMASTGAGRGHGRGPGRHDAAGNTLAN